MAIFLVKKNGEVEIVSTSIEEIKVFLECSLQECVIELWEHGVKQHSYSTIEEFIVAVICGSHSKR